MIVFDLDGTLANDSHRQHLLRQTPKRWKEYFELCEGDDICTPLRNLVHSLKGQSLGLWSGRSKLVEAETRRWLQQHELLDLFQQVRMREIDDRTDDTELKRQWLFEQRLTGDPVTLVFEDRKRVVDMWRSEGIVCCQVAPGEF